MRELPGWSPQSPAGAPLPGPAAEPAVAAPDGGGFWHWLWQLSREPGVLEVLIAAALAACSLLFWWRLSKLVRGARSRAALGDYLLGVEQAMHGDLDGAHRRLTSVVERDPENNYARLLLGKVLAQLGEPALAHQQHVYLKTAFGIDSAENDLMLAQSLLEAGRPVEAADAAERALQRAPDRAAGWDFVYRARLQCGDFEAAARAGRRLLSLTRDPAAKRGISQDLARTLAQAGGHLLARGDEAGAAAALAQARAHDEHAEQVPLLAARLAARTGGVDATVRSLALAEAAPSPRLPAVATAVVATSPSGLPVATFAGLLPAQRFACRHCGAPLAQHVTECARCRGATPSALLEPKLVVPLDSPTHAMDAIEANVAHVRRLVRTLTGDDVAQHAAARDELLTLREAAVEELLGAAWRSSGEAEARALSTLQSMGPTIAPALFAASDNLAGQRLLPLGSRSPGALVGRVVQGFDRAALPHVAPLFASAKPEHRKILIDFFLGLADLEQFQLVLERFPPMEILHRLNKAEAKVLRRFLQVVPKGHFVAETLLLEPTFYRDEELLAAVPDANDPEVLLTVLRRRGPTRSLTKILIEALASSELASVAERVLGELGEAVLEHVLAAFADAERSAEQRRRLGRVLVVGGAAAAAHLADSFGPEPSAFDDELRAVLVQIGDPAVAPLLAAYEHSGWLEKVSIGLISRHTNRRVQIILSLRALGSAPARAALTSMLAGERDDNLRMRLSQALHDGPRGGADGPDR
ncbi:MAG: hypothetical protein IT455_07895 [Planctomycetes bacterium]|nr:hypothetical protein [Planctomycetota bacterium]